MENDGDTEARMSPENIIYGAENMQTENGIPANFLRPICAKISQTKTKNERDKGGEELQTAIYVAANIKTLTGIQRIS